MRPHPLPQSTGRTPVSAVIRFKPFSLPITIAVAVLAYFWTQYRHNAELEQAQIEVAVANHQADLAINVMQIAISYADSVTTIADSAVKRAEAAAARRAAQAPAVAKVVAAAPDTCKPAIEALQGQLASSQAEAEGWHDAYDEQKAATAKLQAAGEAVIPAVQAQTEASKSLADASKPGFFARLVPKVGFGAAAGIDPIDRTFHPVVGVTASWSF